MSTQNRSSGKRYVSIVGSVVSGRSGNGWFGRYTGSESVMQAIGTAGDIDVYINSPGGSVFAGFEILNALNTATSAGRMVNIYVSAMAASIASYISSGVKGAKVIMAENAKLMFHAPWTYVMGSKDQLKDTADLLGKMEDDIIRAIESRGAKADREWMAAGRAKWLSAKEAIEAKLADAIGNPPQDLLDAVVKEGAPSYGGSHDEGWDKTEDRGRNLSAGDRFAASSSFEGYVQALAEEQYGEGIGVTDIGAGSFRVTKKDGTSALLKYRQDSLNIVAIDWESAVFASKQEDDMDEKEKAALAAKAKADADAKAKEEADAKAKADADAKAKEEADAKAKADADALKAKEEADAKAKADADALKAKELPEGMTVDMIAFAKKNYQIARDEHIAAIKASKTCAFSDEELAAFPIETLAKMAKLAEKPAATAKPSIDNSLIDPAKTAKGTGGTLPPPEN